MTGQLFKRYLAAGAVAGLVFNVGGISASVIMDLADTFAAFGVEPSAAAGMLHMALRFGLGFVTAWLILLVGGAPVRHRSVSVKVGLAVWFCAYVPGGFVLNEVGVLTNYQLWFSITWGLAESLVAALVAASVLQSGPVDG